MLDNKCSLSGCTVGQPIEGAIMDIDYHAVKEALRLYPMTKENKKMTLILALSYSGKWEIINAVKEIINNKISEAAVNEELFKQYLTTKNVPDPELLIRTSGEHRISNFMLWQIAYSELYFTDKMWPDFRRADLKEAIINYQKRERRFGKTNNEK